MSEYFTHQSVLEFYPCCCKRKDFHLLKTELYSCITHLSFLIYHPSVDTGCFHVLALLTMQRWTRVQKVLRDLDFIPLYVYARGRTAGSYGRSGFSPFSGEAVPVYVPTNSVWVFLFLNIPANVLPLVFWGTDTNRRETLSHWDFDLITRDIEHLAHCLLSLGKCLLESFVHFRLGFGFFHKLFIFRMFTHHWVGGLLILSPTA